MITVSKSYACLEISKKPQKRENFHISMRINCITPSLKIKKSQKLKPQGTEKGRLSG